MKIIKLSAIGSTNDYLKAKSKEGTVADETVVTTFDQFQGRGQRGSFWQFQAGKSLAMSALKRFDSLSVSNRFKINLAVSLAVKKALVALGIPKVSVKWPNDIMADGKKVGGILIENTLQGAQIAHSIIGMGININNDEFSDLPKASSLGQLTGKTYDVDAVMSAILKQLFSELVKLEMTPMDELIRQYEACLFKKDQIAVFDTHLGNRFNGIIRGVTPLGALIVADEDEVLSFYQLKEISLLY